MVLKVLAENQEIDNFKGMQEEAYGIIASAARMNCVSTKRKKCNRVSRNKL